MEGYGYVSRIVAIFVLLFGTFAAGTLPIVIMKKLKNRKQDTKDDKESISSNLFVSFLMCFGGGVLFATCFVHLLPEVRDSFSSYYESNKTETDTSHESHPFPLPEFLICAGFLAVYFVEEILHVALGHAHRHDGPESHGHSHSPVVLTCYNRDSEITASFKNGEAKYGSTDNHESPPVATIFQGDQTVFEADTLRLHNKEVSETTLSESGAPPPPNAHGHSHLPGQKVQVSIGGLLIVVALSFHSIFEGMAIGLQKSNGDVYAMLIAVAIHKFVIAFVVGMEVFAEGTRVVVLITYMVIFALMSPIGIVLGMVSELSLDSLAVGYLNALATGTLLYVTFFEVLQREKNSRLLGIYQFLAVTLGFVIMTVISYYSE